MTGEPFGFIEEFFNMLDPKDEEVRDMFGQIPRKIFDGRFSRNLVHFHPEEDDMEGKWNTTQFLLGNISSLLF